MKIAFFRWYVKKYYRIKYINKTESQVIIAKYYFLLYGNFVVNNALDFGVILEKCGVGKETSQVVIKKLSELDTDLSASEIIELYEYIGRYMGK